MQTDSKSTMAQMCTFVLLQHVGVTYMSGSKYSRLNSAPQDEYFHTGRSARNFHGLPKVPNSLSTINMQNLKPKLSPGNLAMVFDKGFQRQFSLLTNTTTSQKACFPFNKNNHDVDFSKRICAMDRTTNVHTRDLKIAWGSQSAQQSTHSAVHQASL